ncbi:MAG: hypothetical protein ACTSPV_18850 [Candidatus Hodarchaeales archaeon]
MLTSQSSTDEFIKRIDKFLYQMNISKIDADALKDKIDSLTDNAKNALIQGLKDKDTAKVLKILGLSPRKGGVL